MMPKQTTLKLRTTSSSDLPHWWLLNKYATELNKDSRQWKVAYPITLTLSFYRTLKKSMVLSYQRKKITDYTKEETDQWIMHFHNAVGYPLGAGLIVDPAVELEDDSPKEW